MNLVRRLSAVLAVCVLLSALLAPQAGAAAASGSDEASFVARINSVRANAGLPALQVDGQLTSLARGWAGQQRDGVCGGGNHICHANPISAGVTHAWAKLGENVGTGGDVPSVMTAFINSPGHYLNIVDPSFTHVGVGVVWLDGRMYTTHRFMSLQGAAAPTTTTVAPTTTTTTTAAPTTTTTTTIASSTPRPNPPAPTTTLPAEPDPTPTAAPEPVAAPTARPSQNESEAPAALPVADPADEPIEVRTERADVVIRALVLISSG